MNKLMDKNPQINLGLLFTLTIAIAVLGIAAEIIFVTNYLGGLAQELSGLTIGKIPH